MLLGIALIYGGVFLYPGERNELQNRFEDLWLKLSIFEEGSTTVALKSAHASARVISHFFTVLFGESFFSRQSVMTSTVLSAWLSPALAMYIGLFVVTWEYELVDLLLKETEVKSRWVAASIAYSVPAIFMGFWTAYIVKGTMRPSFRESYHKSVARFVVTMAIFLVFGPAIVIAATVMAKMAVNPVGLILGALTAVVLLSSIAIADVFSIYITRRILRHVMTSISNVHVLLLFLLDGLIVLFAALVPAACVAGITWLGVVLSSGSTSMLSAEILFLAGACLMMNLTTALPTLIYFFLALSIAVHMLFWPAILRPLYGLVDAKLFDNRKLLISSGLTLLSMGIWPEATHGLLKNTMEFVGDWL